ncbi:hypothetical protein DRV84_09895 [Rhodosalinus sediminis]|uniref:Transposase DDE domain-containing protein n=1 Tax=Rhodosalinus sediminis TaxID=1940533 RepID=A0A3D9BSJ5_9RHOB|nr:hypothetical protein DRV84_09895 [Rhodosalinus sediminis]
MLVVQEREDNLLLDRFFLVTSLDHGQMSRQEVLDHDRERGPRRGSYGRTEGRPRPRALIDQPAEVALAGSEAAERLRGRRCLRPAHQVRLLISLLTYQLTHIARRAMAHITGAAGACATRAITCAAPALGLSSRADG